jgi:hypothetical protein
MSGAGTIRRMLERFAPPPESDHLRIDSGYRQGDSVTPSTTQKREHLRPH